MCLVILQREVLIRKAEDIMNIFVQSHDGKRIGTARQLLARLIKMVQVQMRIAETVNELSRLQARDLRHHQGEKRIGCDVERHT
jgi:hypothetical protein